jgi:hypothetical protein
VAFVVTAAGCAVLAWAVPDAKRADFDAFLAGRVRRMAGRMLLVIVVVALGVGLLGRSAVAVTAGALAGWLFASLGELRRAKQNDEGRRRR